MADYSISPEVAARIDKLERESRVLRRISFVTTLALVAVTAIGAAAVRSGTVTSGRSWSLSMSTWSQRRVSASRRHLRLRG